MTNCGVGNENPRRPSFIHFVYIASFYLLLLCSSIASLDVAEAFSSASTSSSSMSSQLRQHDYPRPLHPGGFSLPPLVEDRLPIVAPKSEGVGDDDMLRADVLLIRPPDMESLWEWYAYTKRRSDADPSWGRVWPTALSLARWVLRATTDEGTSTEGRTSLAEQAANAARTASHVVEVGCGLGAAGLVCACGGAAGATPRRTITFLDREPYALHCVMASASANGLATGSLTPADGAEPSGDEEDVSPRVTARAAVDDWTLPANDDDDNASAVKNVHYRDLHLSSLSGYDNSNVVLLASDILYEPSNMDSLATKLRGLLHPIDGGYALLADPLKERTEGCRESFVKSAEELGGEVEISPMPELKGSNVGLGLGGMQNTVLESDMDIDGSLCKSVLIVVHFRRRGGSSTTN